MTLLLRLGVRLMRQLPGSAALRLARDWRDLAWLAEADVAMVSFPKSGRTFVRAMLARLFQAQFGIDDSGLLEFSTLRRASPGVPRLLFTHDGDAMRRPSEIAINKAAYRHCRVALLARHPGDVVVSRYHHLKHRSRDPERRRLADQPMGDFVWTDQGGIPSIVTFLNEWAAHARERSGILILRYEDFRSAPATALGALARFVGLAAEDADIAGAVEFGGFDALKEREREGYFTSKRLRARSSNADSFKVRAGKSGGYRAQLDDATCARIDAYIDAHLDPVYGYAVSA